MNFIASVICTACGTLVYITSKLNADSWLNICKALRTVRCRTMFILWYIITLLLILSVEHVQASGGCRKLKFLDCIKNKALVNHTIHTSNVPSPGLVQCKHKCFINDACVSYNLGPTRGMMRTCELSNTDHVGYPDHVVVKEGFEYCPIKNPCTFSPCTSLQICKPDFSRDTFTCFNTCASNPCPPYYENCVQDPLSLALECSGSSPSCFTALGMEDGRISDSAITASSVYNAFTHGSFRGRLNNKQVDGSHQSAWTAKVNHVGEYLQIDLGQEFYITKVATQGREYTGVYVLSQWVKTYSLQYGLDGVTWNNYMISRELKILTGNTDTTSIVTNTLASPFRAQFVRIVVQSWNAKHISMRAELYGCQA